jgi:membrane fusion protein (multidrug efflux system)
MTMSPAHIAKKAGLPVVAVAALVLLLLYLQGTIGGHKVGPHTVALRESSAPAGKVVAVEQREVEDVMDWPGTVASRTVANVAPKVMAHILEVRVNIGSVVHSGEVLATLDDREVKARAQQARAALTAAQAHAAQAQTDLRRVRTLFHKQAATSQDLDAVEARAKATGAQVAQARDAVTEAEVLLGETTIRAPLDGVVASRLVDPGDMAQPGKPMLVIQDPHSLRLESYVPTNCAGMLAIGVEVPVRFDAPARELPARIEEIAPTADPQSRTRLIKAALPPASDLQPGLFATLRAPCGKHLALLIPTRAVMRKGQLEMVHVLENGNPRLRDIKTGVTYGDQTEVLSGLRAGEQVLVSDAS